MAQNDSKVQKEQSIRKKKKKTAEIKLFKIRIKIKKKRNGQNTTRKQQDKK